MKKTLSVILALMLSLTVILCGCGEKAETAGEFVLASTLSPEDQAQVDKTLATFMQCYEEDNAKGILPLLSENFNTTEEDTLKFFSDVRALAENPFVPYDSYYINGVTVSDTIIKVKKTETDKNYIELTPAYEEFYCAFYASEGEKVSYMMTIFLVREGGEFKIMYVNPGDFKHQGQDAPALFEKTKELYNDGKLLPAYITSCMLGITLRPGQYLRYENHIEMEDMCYKLFSEVTEKIELPLTLENTSNSSLYAIQITKNPTYGILPYILLKTDVPVTDTASLEQECQKVLNELEKLSPGLRETFEHIEMNATNSTPTDAEPSDTTPVIITTK